MHIESRANERIKNAVKLKSKASRQVKRLFFFEGVSLLEDYLRNGHVPNTIFVTENAKKSYSDLLTAVESSRIITVSDSVYQKLSAEKAPQGIFVISEFLDGNIVFINSDQHFKALTECKKSLIFLDSLQDNGNVGTIIRTAAALGGADCVLSRDCADIYSSRTIRASMGALFSARVFITDDISQAIRAVRQSGRRVFAAALGNNTLTLGKFDAYHDDCFVIGNEGNGLAGEIIDICDGEVKIPISGDIDSLNASVAAAILLWELKKGDDIDG